jgi:hypothetical protein
MFDYSKVGSGYRNDLSKEEILKISKDEREKRKRLKDQEKVSSIIQKYIRGYIECKKLQAEIE